MNSSGIKRGLATTAVTALAVAGVPFIASPASAASGDSLGYLSTGALRNGNAAGGEFYISSSSATLDIADFRVSPNANYSDSVAVNATADPEIQSAAFDVDIIGLTIRDFDPATPGNQKYPDGLYHYTVTAAVTLGSASQATFGLFEDADASGAISASDPKVQLAITPTGAVASVEITPESQTTATGVANAAEYDVTVKDSAGRVTQVVAGEALNASISEGTVTGTLDDSTMSDGVGEISAYSDNAGNKTITVKGDGAANSIPASVSDTASLVVKAQATIDEDEFDFATGADTWDSSSSFGDSVQVRVDQGSITFNFASKDKTAGAPTPDDANSVVLLTLVGNGGVKFDGETTKTYSVNLDADGKGSLTVKPTGVVATSGFTFDSPSFGAAPATDVDFSRAEATSVDTDSDVYVAKAGSPTDVTVSVLDQFGDPIGAPAQVQIVRDGVRNTGSTARQTVNAAGEATFTLADAGTVAPYTESLDVKLFDDQFDGMGQTFLDVAAIRYTADGRGDDFLVQGATETAADTVVTPVYDGTATDGVDAVTIDLIGGTNGTPANVTVDNGALVLVGSETTLPQGAASDKVTLDGNESFTVIGTKTGVVNVTIENAGRTKNVALTIKQDAATVADTARNVDIEGPTQVTAGDVATYTAVVTDAFGNPVPGVDDSQIIFTVSGPGNPQNKEAATDATGEIEQTVLLTDSANSDITVKVTGTGAQFGARATEFEAGDGLNTAPGITISQDSDPLTSTVVNIGDLEQAVEDAEIALAEAQADLASAQAELDVAQAELAIAQANVDTLTAKKQKLRQKLNRAKANDNKQKAKTTRKKLRQTKRALRAAQDDVTLAQAKVDARSTVVDLRQTQVDKAQADLDEAEANLEEAQG